MKKSLAQKRGARQATPLTDPRLALYCRGSSDDPADKDTIQAQLTFLRTWATQYALPIVGEYTDATANGTTPLAERPGGARLLADARSGVYTLVLVTRFERLTDALAVLVEALEVFAQAGVRVRSAAEGTITPETPGGHNALCTHVSVLEYLRTRQPTAPLSAATLPPPVPLPVAGEEDTEAADADQHAPWGLRSPDDHPLPERYPTREAASAAGRALGQPCYIAFRERLGLPSRRHTGAGESAATVTGSWYQVVLCSAATQAQVAEDMFQARQLLLGEPINRARFSPMDKALLATIYGLASSWPRALTEEERHAEERRLRRQSWAFERERLQHQREYDAIIEGHDERKRRAVSAIAQGIASPWRASEDAIRQDRAWREEQLRRLEAASQQDALDQQTVEARLGGIAMRWQPSLATLTEMALEQGLASPWPRPPAPPRRPGRTALSPHHLRRLSRIIAAYRRKEVP